MKILVHAGTLGPEDRRMTLAARGLALRGHEVRWRGGIDEPSSPVESRRALARTHADVVIGGGLNPGRVALSGWLARAQAMVLALDAARVRTWNHGQRWCWESLESAGVVESGEWEMITTLQGAVDLDRLSAWPDAQTPDRPDPGHPDVELLERLCERVLARRRTRSRRRAVFLDRDGTLVVERGYVGRPDDVELLPHAPEGLRQLAAAGFALVVVSNQSGVARGLYSLESAYATMAALRVLLRRHGVELDAIYFCPHHPDEGCACRKPGVALLEQAADNLALALRESVMVGDKLTDVATGHGARASSVLVRTGYGREEEQRLSSLKCPPDRVCDDLLEVSCWLAGQAETRAE